MSGARGGGLGWLGIVRLGLVQASLGAIVVLMTSTMNRVMTVELALPAVLPGALVGWHHALQMVRPRFGHGSDVGGRRAPWIMGGIVVLALGGVGAALATALMAEDVVAGIALGIVAFTLIGFGVGAAGTTLLVLLAKRVVPARRAAAATIVWTMMIAGFAVTTTVAGRFLDPFSLTRLVEVTACVAAIAVVVTALALWGVERAPEIAEPAPAEAGAFRAALAEVWRESRARRFTVFIFVSMLAYSALDLVLEPFAGAVFGMTPGETTRLSGLQNGGTMAGMIAMAVAGTLGARTWIGSLRGWTVGGCIGSALMLAAIATSASAAPDWPLKPAVFLLGISNGAFAVAAIGSMMGMASDGASGREGVRMGMWGAAQAIAFALGGFLGPLAADVARLAFGAVGPAYALVFALDAALFLAAAAMAASVIAPRASMSAPLASRDEAPLARGA